jgi:hypothetical protein
MLLVVLVEEGHLTVPHGGIAGANRQLIKEALEKAKRCKQALEADLHIANPIPPPTRTAMGSLSAGSGSALAYSVQTNITGNAFELIVPEGMSITGTSIPPTFACTDIGDTEQCKNGTVQPNTPLTGSFDHTGTIMANCGCVVVAFSADNGVRWSSPVPLTGPQSVSPMPPPPPPTQISTSLTLSCPPTAPLDAAFSVSGSLTPPFATAVTITYTPPSGPSVTRMQTTDSSGNYADAAAASQTGTWTIRASYAGNSQYAPSQSPTCTTSVT